MAEYIYGKNVVRQLLHEDKRVHVIYFAEKFKDKEIINLAQRHHLKIKWVSSHQLDTLSNNGLHQGVVAEIDDYKYFDVSEMIAEPRGNYPLLVMLDGIEDPHNLGAILRTCDAIGADGIIICKHRSVGLNATVAKVSTGAIESVKVAQVTNLTKTLLELKEKGFWVVGAEMDETAQEYSKCKYDMPLILVIGSEGNGISSLVKKNCDFLVYLPMQGKINSLNASVACGVLLYQIYTQREQSKK